MAKSLPYIEIPIIQCNLAFIYALLFLVNKKPTSENKCPAQNRHKRSNDDTLRFKKLRKALLLISIFTDRKNLSIDQ